MKSSMFMVTFPKQLGKEKQERNLEVSEISSQTTTLVNESAPALQEEQTGVVQSNLTELTAGEANATAKLSVETGIEMKEAKVLEESERENSPSSQQDTMQKSPEVEQENLLEGVNDVDFTKVIQRLCRRYKISKCNWLQGLNGLDVTVTFVVESGLIEEEILDVLMHHGISKIEGTSLSISPVTVYAACEKKKLPRDKSYGALSSNSQASSKKMEETVLPERHVQIEVAIDELDSESSLLDESEDEEEDGFIKSIQSRIIVRPVIEGLRRNAEFTFDYLMFIIIASVISTIGLIENSSVILVASMLISPLMGPILAGTFGATIQDWELTIIGLRSELIGLFLCVLTGFLVGLPVVYLVESLSWIETWPSVEMYTRGSPQNLGIGAVIASFSGAGVALSVLGENSGSLVGVAISASLLPPAVNTGLLWAISLAEATYSEQIQQNLLNNTTNTLTAVPDLSSCSSRFLQSYKHQYACNSSQEAFVLGLISFTLTVINIILIIFGSIIVLKIKQVSPRASCNNERAFWMTHIEVAKNYQKTIKAHKDHAELKKLKAHVRNIVENIEADAAHKTVRLRYPSGGVQETVLDELFNGATYYKTLPSNIWNTPATPTSPGVKLPALVSRQKSAQGTLESKEFSRKKKGRFTVDKPKDI